MVLYGKIPTYLRGTIGVNPRNDHVFLAMGGHDAENARNLLRRLSRAVNDLGGSLAKPTMEVDFREADVLVGCLFQRQQRLIDADFSVAHAFKKPFCRCIHSVHRSVLFRGGFCPLENEGL